MYSTIHRSIQNIMQGFCVLTVLATIVMPLSTFAQNSPSSIIEPNMPVIIVPGDTDTSTIPSINISPAEYITQQREYTINKNEELRIDLQRSDTTIQSVIFAGNPSSGVVLVDTSNSVVVYKPNEGFIGSDLVAFAYRYTIDNEKFRGMVAKITVRDPASVINRTDTFTLTQNRYITISTPDNTISSITITQPPRNGIAEVDTITRVLRYLPNADYVGQDELLYQYCTLNNQCLNGKFIFDIITGNETPTIMTLPSTSRLNYDINQPGMTIFQITRVIEPVKGTLTINQETGIATYIPNQQETGQDTFKFRVCYRPLFTCAIIYNQIILSNPRAT